MKIYEGPWLFRGECLDEECAHVARRHRHKVRHYEVDDRVIVHDLTGPRPGRVTHYADDKLYVEGPRIAGDSRSVHWIVPEHLIDRCVTPQAQR